MMYLKKNNNNKQLKIQRTKGTKWTHVLISEVLITWTFDYKNYGMNVSTGNELTAFHIYEFNKLAAIFKILITKWTKGVLTCVRDLRMKLK